MRGLQAERQGALDLRTELDLRPRGRRSPPPPPPGSSAGSPGDRGATERGHARPPAPSDTPSARWSPSGAGRGRARDASFAHAAISGNHGQGTIMLPELTRPGLEGTDRSPRSPRAIRRGRRRGRSGASRPGHDRGARPVRALPARSGRREEARAIDGRHRAAVFFAAMARASAPRGLEGLAGLREAHGLARVREHPGHDRSQGLGDLGASSPSLPGQGQIEVVLQAAAEVRELDRRARTRETAILLADGSSPRPGT